jgi:hypothetical protein
VQNLSSLARIFARDNALKNPGHDFADECLVPLLLELRNNPAAILTQSYVGMVIAVLGGTPELHRASQNHCPAHRPASTTKHRLTGKIDEKEVRDSLSGLHEDLQSAIRDGAK